MNRKTFITRTLGAVLLLLTSYSFMSCSDEDTTTDASANDDSEGDDIPNEDSDNDDDDDDENLDCLENGTRETGINNNHGHTLTVSKEDIAAGVEKAYEIQGTSEHSHTILVSAANFSALIDSKTLAIESTTVNDHRHYVTISCA